MTLILDRIWGRVQRPWGYEVRADYLDDTGGVYNEVLVFAASPDDAMLAAAVEARRVRVETSLLPPDPTYQVTCEDGTVVRL